MRSASPRRSALAALVVALATACLGLIAPAAAHASPVLMGGATLSHPYSAPVWWPLRTETMMDCYHGNPGCRAPSIQHSTWLMDVVSTDGSTPVAHEPVYAMGAGIVHYGVHRSVGCGGPIPHGRGNWLWIDHGNGVVSWYGHLAWPFKVPDGAYVTPKTQIALIGNSGYSNCRRFPNLHYIDIAVKRNATNGQETGQYTEVTHLYACEDGVRQSWPDSLNSAWHKWNDVPSSPYGDRHYIPASDADSDCIPDTPATPDRTTTVHLTRRATNALRASWALPAGGPTRRSVVVLIREYHPAIRRWLDLRKHVLPGTARATTFTGLHHNHSFRVQVTFLNRVGPSAPSPAAGAVAR